jgi:hypothetical protein
MAMNDLAAVISMRAEPTPILTSRWSGSFPFCFPDKVVGIIIPDIGNLRAITTPSVRSVI